MCLVEELNFNVFYIPLRLEDHLSGRRSCPIPLSIVFPTSQHGMIHFTSLKGCRCHLRYKQPRIWEDAGCQGKMQISFHPFGLLCPPSASPSMPQNSWDPALGRLLLLLGSGGGCQLAGVVSGCGFCSVTGLGNTTSASGTQASGEELL